MSDSPPAARPPDPADASASAATDVRLLDAAEELFAANGFTATSLRQITTAARANIAAVNYHFGSKEGLLRAVFERRLVPLNQERHEALDRVAAKFDGRELPVRSLLVAFLSPALRLVEQPGGQRFLRLLGRLHGEPDRSPATELFLEQFREIVRRFMPLLSRSLPTVSQEDLAWRMHFTIGAMAQTMMCVEGIELLSGGNGTTSNPEATLARLVDFAVAGLAAPRSSKEKDPG